MEQKTLYLQIITSTEPAYEGSRYVTTSVHVRTVCIESLVDLISGCVDNKAGYGSVAAANRLHDIYTSYLSAGYTLLAQPSFEFRSVRVAYQHYEGDSYCEPRVDVGSVRLRDLEQKVRFLRKLSDRGRLPATPQAFIDQARKFAHVQTAPEYSKDDVVVAIHKGKKVSTLFR